MRPTFLGIAAVALFIGGVIAAPLTSDIAMSVCPAGEVVNSEVAGFNCVTQCPPGMLLDAETDTCAAGTVDPPSLAGSWGPHNTVIGV